MFERYAKSLKVLLSRGDGLAFAAALLLALGVYFFLQTLVEGLISPIVAAVLNEPSIHMLGFTINGSEFSYGSVIAGLILLVLVFAVAATASRAGNDDRGS
ncbi:MAG TPA: hypothetical protein VF125_05375 [Solirubrobacterales bacterium]